MLVAYYRTYFSMVVLHIAVRTVVRNFFSASLALVRLMFPFWAKFGKNKVWENGLYAMHINPYESP